MLSHLLSPQPTLYAILLDVGDRSSEDNDYRVLGGQTDPRLARTIAKSLNASIRAAYETQSEFRRRQNELQRRHPDRFADGYHRYLAHQRRRIPNDYGVRISYEDVERGAHVSVTQMRMLACRAGGSQ